MSLTPAQIEARELLAPIKFHQIFKLPVTEKHAELKVSYAVAGPSDENAPTILFVVGMLGIRWLAFSFDHVAMEEGVRMIFIDRWVASPFALWGIRISSDTGCAHHCIVQSSKKHKFVRICDQAIEDTLVPNLVSRVSTWFRGSTSVPLQDRLSIYLETVPLLLKHLNIEHVSLASHSAGTIYALNIIATLPHIICPKRPRITLLSPWVHQNLSSTTFLQIASKLPNTMINHWGSVMNFVLNSATPMIASSGSVFSTLKSSFSAAATGAAMQKEAAEQKVREAYGVSKETKREMDSLIFKWAFLEDTTGLNDEARLCLKKTDDCNWNACENYEEMVKNLVELWTQRVERNQSARLDVKIYFAEEDIMIGEKGKEYFRNCWTSEDWTAGIAVDCEQLKGTDHDSILDPLRSLREIAKTARQTLD